MPEQQVVYSTRTGAPDVVEVATAAEAEVLALLREREGYARRGLTDRVAQVDAQLDARGHKRPAEAAPAAAAKRGPGRPRRTPPAGGG
ncbi:hypothetical protein [Actinomadura sp. NPDC049753]|uniref:hypothetical protein n=1 Tax=Actinomadura sp. NPDC049753 TaxID=3154739 RepID=UPI00344051EF